MTNVNKSAGQNPAQHIAIFNCLTLLIACLTLTVFALVVKLYSAMKKAMHIACPNAPRVLYATKTAIRRLQIRPLRFVRSVIPTSVWQYGKWFTNKRRARNRARRSASILKNALTPKIGTLWQYEPRPMTIASRRHDRKSVSDCKVSVVIPSFNQGKFIERTIKSLIDNEYPNLEVFVQDNASVDETGKILHKYSNFLQGYFIEKDSGQANAINRGFARTRGEIMAWLNSDDLLLPKALHTISAFFRDNPDVDVAYGNRLVIDEEDREVGRWILPTHDNDVLSWADFIPQECLFWRRSMWEKVGEKVDESFHFAMDWDLILRFRSAGAKFALIPEFLGAFRVHESQKTTAQMAQVGAREMSLIRLRELGVIPSAEQIRAAVLPYAIAHMVTDAQYALNMQLRAIMRS